MSSLPTNLRNFFAPESVAVIGASRNPSKVGHVVLKNIVNGGFKGKIYPINPSADEILGLKCYKSIIEVPDHVDLAVVCVPAQIVLKVAEECGKKGVYFLTVISAGFKEAGGEGIERERKLVEICRKYGMRLLGPNCLGFIDTYTPINASFSAKMPKKGGIAFISQSGALCTAILDWSEERGIGFSKFISLGNKADLDETDFIREAGRDENTKVILLYLESVEKGRDFLKVVKEVSKIKPIVVLKGGITEVGARAATSHTGAAAGSFTAYKTAFEQGNVIIANSVGELFDYALTFVSQPILRQRKVAIITNAGGPGILTADLCSKLGIEVASFNKETIDKLRSKLPPASNIYNPVDVLGDAQADRYEVALNIVLSDENVGGVIVILTPQAMTQPLETAKAILRMKKKYPNKAIVTAFMGGPTVAEASKLLIENGIPCFDLPERAVLSLYGLVKYSERVFEIMEEEAPHVFYDVDKGRVFEIFKTVREDGRVVLLEHEAKEVARAYGILTPITILAKNEDEAVEAAKVIGYPVVLKISSPQIIHKTDIGGVILNVNSDEEVRRAYRTIMNRVSRYAPQARIYGVCVQKMVPRGKEMIIGAVKDPQFGHLIMFGLGGIYTNILRDFSFRLSPVTLTEARKMIQETKAYMLLRGVRGEPRSDINSVVNVIMRLSQLVRDFPEIAEIDINPLYVYREGEGCLALDVKITLSK